MTELVRVEGVSVQFGTRTVLDGVNLSIRRGEIVTVIGPNGAGKSTLVRVVLGLTRAASGRVRRAPGLTLGYVPQRISIDPVLPLSVRRFLHLGCRTDDARLTGTLQEVGALHVVDSAVQEVSGGEFQRVLLARALLRDPDLLILDEPVQGVDVTGQEELYALFRKVRDRRGCGILMVSHDLHLVMAATDRVVCLNQGVCCSGVPAPVEAPAAWPGITTAPKELALYTHHHDNGKPCTVCHRHGGHNHG